MRSKAAIFVISYNRVSVLKESLESYLRFVDSKDIYIIDKGSDYQPLLEYYEALRANGVNIIYSNPLIGGPDALNEISDVIDKFKDGYTHYAVTDPDISLATADPGALDVYIHFLELFPSVEIAGPMLGIIDIPKEYPARAWCWKRHVDQFWHKIPKTLAHRGRNIHYQFALIDTSFGVVRSSTRFRRLLKGVRVYQPYEAQHLDWYITESNMPEDQRHYMLTSNQNVAHWGGPWYQSPPTHEVLDGHERDIYIVERKESGEYGIKLVTLDEC